MAKKHAIKAGSVVEIGYPFVMDQRDGRDTDGAPLYDPSWRPGIKVVPVHDDHDAAADAIGTMVLTVVATFNVADCLAREVVYVNDEGFGGRTVIGAHGREYFLRVEGPEERWTRVRKWVEAQIKKPAPTEPGV